MNNQIRNLFINEKSLQNEGLSFNDITIENIIQYIENKK